MPPVVLERAGCGMAKGGEVVSEPDYKRETLQTAEERSGETVAQLEARIAALESTLQTIADTHGPGTMAGDAVREALKP